MAKKSFGAKKLAICAALSALCVVLLWVGALIGIMDISMAVIASVLPFIALIEYGGWAPFLVYASAAILSVILLPQNSAAWLFLCFFGYYPIIKARVERLKRPVAWIIKELVFNAFLAAALLISKFLLASGANEPLYLYIILALLSELMFPLYDILLGRIALLYIRKLSGKLKFK